MDLGNEDKVCHGCSDESEQNQLIASFLKGCKDPRNASQGQHPAGKGGKLTGVTILPISESLEEFPCHCNTRKLLSVHYEFYKQLPARGRLQACKYHRILMGVSPKVRM